MDALVKWLEVYLELVIVKDIIWNTRNIRYGKENR